MPTINDKDIRKGDTIRIEWDYMGVRCTNEGVAHHYDRGQWHTVDGGLLGAGWYIGVTNIRIMLVSRPKPALPTQEGTVIIAEQPVEDEPVALVLRDGKWWYLDGSSYYHPTAVFNHPWRLAKVIEA